MYLCAYECKHTWAQTHSHTLTHSLSLSHTHTHTRLNNIIEGKAIPELKDKNKATLAKWRVMSEEEKQRYYQLAAQVPTVSSPSHSSLMYNKWHETHRVLSNLQENVQ